MVEPDEHRAADDLVEPLFGGLRGADSAGDQAPGSGEAVSSDPWRHRARLASSERETGVPEADKLPLGLYLKAFLVMIALIGIGAAVYFVFGV